MNIFCVKLNHPSLAGDGNMLLQNFGIHLQEYVVSLPEDHKCGIKICISMVGLLCIYVFYSHIMFGVS